MSQAGEESISVACFRAWNHGIAKAALNLGDDGFPDLLLEAIRAVSPFRFALMMVYRPVARPYCVHHNRMHERVPTVSVRIDGHNPEDLARGLGGQGIFVWHGHNYAYEPSRQLGLPLDEGVVRIGLAHYNTEAEVDRITASLSALSERS